VFAADSLLSDMGAGFQGDSSTQLRYRDPEKISLDDGEWLRDPG
jgi:hypothetical protein